MARGGRLTSHKYHHKKPPLHTVCHAILQWCSLKEWSVMFPCFHKAVILITDHDDEYSRGAENFGQVFGRGNPDWGENDDLKGSWSCRQQLGHCL